MTLAEIAVTIAALSAVAGVVTRESMSVTASGLLRDVALIGMLVALFAVLPLALVDFGAARVITRSALVAAVSWLVGYVAYLNGVRKDRSQISTAFWLGLVITVVGEALLVTAAMNLLGLGATWYVLGLIAFLSIAGLNFIASVFGGNNPQH